MHRDLVSSQDRYNTVILQYSTWRNPYLSRCPLAQALESVNRKHRRNADKPTNKHEAINTPS
jgi:hypothetical protein